MTFTITLNNAGNTQETGITVTDTLPDGYSYVGSSIGSDTSGVSGTVPTITTGVSGSTLTWDLDLLDAGDSVDLTFDAVVQSSGDYDNLRGKSKGIMETARTTLRALLGA